MNAELMARWKKTYDLVQQVQQLGQQIEAVAGDALSQAIVINDDVDDIERQITSGKAESIQYDKEFARVLNAYNDARKDASRTDVCVQFDALIAHIEAVREKDRQEAEIDGMALMCETTKKSLCDEFGIGYIEGTEQTYLQVEAEVQEQMTSWRDRAIKAEAERDHWKANHADVVARLKLATQRPDLPVDRIPAIRELDAMQERAEKAEAELKAIAERQAEANAKRCICVGSSTWLCPIHGIDSKQRKAARQSPDTEKLKEALEIGRDAAHEVAQRFHEEMKGYREAEHKQVDADVATIEAAIAILSPAQQEPAMEGRAKCHMDGGDCGAGGFCNDCHLGKEAASATDDRSHDADA